MFGDSMEKVKTPYVVIKTIAGGDRIVLQIFVHMTSGTHDLISNYTLNELSTLLKQPIDYDGKSVTARSTGAWREPYVDEGDNTFAMSRDFFVPVII